MFYTMYYLSLRCFREKISLTNVVCCFSMWPRYLKWWIQGSLVNFICETKPVSKQEVFIMVTCSSKVMQWTETIISQVGHFSLYSLNLLCRCMMGLTRVVCVTSNVLLFQFTSCPNFTKRIISRLSAPWRNCCRLSSLSEIRRIWCSKCIK